MRPLLFFWGAGKGGDAAVAIGLAAALKARAIHAPLAAYAYADPEVFQEKAIQAGLENGADFYLISAPEAIWKETGLRRIDFDLIHVHHGRTVPKRTDIVPLKKIAGRLPLILTAHGPLPLKSICYGGLKSKVSRLLSPFWFNAIVVPSEAKAREWRKMTPLAGKVTAIPNIVSFLSRMDKREARKILRREESSELALFCSRLDPDKDPLTFVRAVSEASTHRPRLKGVMLGSGELDEECRALIEELKAPIDLAGYIQDPAPYYNAADVFVQPSLYESFGITFMHAVDLRIKCVASDIEVFRDLYPASKSISWFPHGDASACAEALLHQLDSREQDPPTIQLRERFSAEAAVEAHVKLWFKVLERHGQLPSFENPCSERPASAG